MILTDIGWNDHFNTLSLQSDTTNLIPGRVICRQKNTYYVAFEDGECQAKISGKFHHNALCDSDFPVVGDWVQMTPVRKGETAIIHQLLTRQSCISRNSAGSAGKTEGRESISEQVIAANIDTAFIVNGLDRDFSLRRIERYLATIYAGGVTPVIVLNKADLCENPETQALDVEAVAFGVPVHVTNAATGQGIDTLSKYFRTGLTGAFLGSSGVGKSTIINRLLGFERQKTTPISEKVGKGVHTTTNRELIPVPNGGLVLDNPGMRELQLWDAGEGLADLFQEIHELSHACRYTDCSHLSEPGCAVKAAVDDGTLDPKRLESFFKLKREDDYFAQRKHKTADAIEKEKWKKIRIIQRKFYKE